MKELSHRRRPALSDEKGAVLAVMLLVLVPMLFVLMVLNAEMSRTVEASTSRLSRAAAAAAKAAASAVDPRSQADGKPTIDPEKAHSAFLRALRENLGLEPDLTPKSGSRLCYEPDYELYVYNGDRGEEYGYPSCRVYIFKDGINEVLDFPLYGFPYTFGITENGIDLSGAGKRTVTLDEPGAVVFIQGKIDPVVFSKGKTAARWAAAKVVYKNKKEG